jgi:hypothetical protein
MGQAQDQGEGARVAVPARPAGERHLVVPPASEG